LGRRALTRDSCLDETGPIRGVYSIGCSDSFSKSWDEEFSGDIIERGHDWTPSNSPTYLPYIKETGKSGVLIGHPSLELVCILLVQVLMKWILFALHDEESLGPKSKPT
jgi:hypothetical protein